MLIVVSPAKSLDFDAPAKTKKFTTPSFLDDSQKLVRDLRKLSPDDISALMGVSVKLGALNHERFANWHTPFDLDNAKQALFAFKGDVYIGLDAQQFSAADLTFAQKHLRILSGLYGVLRPLDLMQPYRLEMGRKFASGKAKSLYEFWGERLTQFLNDEFAQQRGKSKTNDGVLINLASNEYFKAVKPKNLDGQVITPVFKDCKNGQYKVISFYAKKARGMMARYIIENKIDSVEALTQFDTAGYYFVEEESNAKELVFKREEQN